VARSSQPKSYRPPGELEGWVEGTLARDGITFTALVDRALYAERDRNVGRYRTKPGISIDAIPVADLHQPIDLPVWVQDAIRRNLIRVNGETVTVMTRDGDRLAWSDGWLLRGTEEEIYSITDSVFRRKYEPVNP
jgi:hypothetical protein